MVAATAQDTTSPPHDCENTYPYAFEKDGWHLVHEALKFDMRLFVKAMSVLADQLADGKALEQWQVTGVQTFYKQFCENMRLHHHHEEAYFFPWIKTKMELPEKVAADHETILMRQNEIADLVETLSATAAAADSLAAVLRIQGKFEIYQADVEEHFQEEERDVAPMMRKLFSYKEYQQVSAKMVKAMGPYELPSLLWHMPDAERREFMKQEGIPAIIQALIIKPKTKKYGKLYIDPLERAISGMPPAPATSKKGFLAIFAASK